MRLEDVLKKEEKIKRSAREGHKLILEKGHCFTDDDGKKLSQDEFVEFVWKKFTNKEFLQFKIK